MGGTETGNVQICHKTDSQNSKNGEAQRNNKKTKTAKIEKLLRDIPEESSQERIIQEKSNLHELQTLEHHSRRAENGKSEKIQKTIEEILLQD